MSDQPGTTASSRPPSTRATPSPSSNHSGRRMFGSSGGPPAGCLVCPAGLTRARAAPARAGAAGGRGGGLVVGEPDRGDHGRLVVDVGGGGHAVVLHDQPPAAVRALTGEQD